jgi:beta-lactamase class D
MKAGLCTGVLGAILMLTTLNAADTPKRKSDTQKQDQSSDMQRAIAFERHKDMAAARQERMEAKHPTVFYDNADRSKDDDLQGRKLVKPTKK